MSGFAAGLVGGEVSLLLWALCSHWGFIRNMLHSQVSHLDSVPNNSPLVHSLCISWGSALVAVLPLQGHVILANYSLPWAFLLAADAVL